MFIDWKCACDCVFSLPVEEKAIMALDKHELFMKSAVIAMAVSPSLSRRRLSRIRKNMSSSWNWRALAVGGLPLCLSRKGPRLASENVQNANLGGGPLGEPLKSEWAFSPTGSGKRQSGDLACSGGVIRGRCLALLGPIEPFSSTGRGKSESQPPHDCLFLDRQGKRESQAHTIIP